MRFILVDRIIGCVPGRSIRTVKALSLAEEYLADHFPAFPVLPGVLMLEAMAQSAGWLVRATYDFGPVLVELEQARNVTYKSFVRPGEVLEMELVAKRMDRESSSFAGKASCGGKEVVKAQLDLRHSYEADLGPERRPLAAQLRSRAREHYKLLGGPTAAEVELVGPDG
jgi:3-hydroxyacyl-[acyl-carrier-protein] dehydratase